MVAALLLAGLLEGALLLGVEVVAALLLLAGLLEGALLLGV